MSVSSKTKLILLNLLVVLVFLVGCKLDKEKVSLQNFKDTYPQNEIAVQHGMELFNEHCASCHNFNQNTIGPSLGGITSEVSKEWLINFIKNPKNTIDTGDKRAVTLYKQYNVFMPHFEFLEDKDIEDILGFMHKYAVAEAKSEYKREGAITNPIPEKIQESNLILILEEFTQIPASSNAPPLARINKLSTFNKGLDERVFIADLRGKLYEIKDGSPIEFLDLDRQLTEFVSEPGFGSGLGSFDFHPDFKRNGLFYTTHTESFKDAMADFPLPDSLNTNLQWVLTEWKQDKPTSSTFTGSHREILRVDMLGSAHGFQELTFNPTAKKGDADYGLLYLGVGDGGAVYTNNLQLTGSVSKIWGTVIRIDPLGNNSRNKSYGIPKDNPFVKNSNAVGEIWAYGFRNPHRITWNLNEVNQVFVSNIGRHSVEEVNLLEKGANYGWPYREGNFVFDSYANPEVVYPLPKDDKGYVYPIIQYDHDEGAAVSGGFVSTGNTLPLLKDKYVFGDIPKGTLFIADVAQLKNGEKVTVQKLGIQINGEVLTLSQLLDGSRVDLRLGSNREGELFVLTKFDGKVYKVVGCKQLAEIL